jgi:hypothetical protein
MYDTTTGYVDLTNTPVSLTKITWSSTHKEGYINLRYELDLLVQDRAGNPIEGATVKIVGNDGNEISESPLTTDANGKIDTTTLLAYYIYYTDSQQVTEYTPFTITISATGYQTKTIKLTMDRKRDEVETLERAVPLFLEAKTKRPLINLEPTNSQNILVFEK